MSDSEAGARAAHYIVAFSTIDAQTATRRVASESVLPGSACRFTPLSPALGDRAAMIDTLYGRILTLLCLMRDICVHAASPRTSAMLAARYQKRVDALNADIDRATEILALLQEDASPAEAAHEIEALERRVLTVLNRLNDAEDAEAQRDRRVAQWMRDLLDR